MAVKDNSLVRVERHSEADGDRVDFYDAETFKTPHGWMYEDTYRGIDKYFDARGRVLYVTRVPANQREALNKILY